MPSLIELALIASVGIVAYKLIQAKKIDQREDFFITSPTAPAASANLEYHEQLISGRLQDHDGKVSGGQYY